MNPIHGSLRRLLPAICLPLVAVLVLATCGGDDDDATATAPTEIDTPPELDLEGFQRAESSYVGSIGDGRAIGIAPLEEVGVEDEGIGVWLYIDRESRAVMTGELDSDGEATLSSAEDSDFEATVELRVEDEAASGTASFPDERATPFTAEAASGVGGVYWAPGSNEDPNVSVVLPDGSRWGIVVRA